MKSYLIFNQNGEILRTISCRTLSDAVDNARNEDEWVIEGEADDINQFIDPETGLITEKLTINPGKIKTSILADSRDLCVFENLPIPCNIEILCSSLSIYHAFTNHEGRLEFGASTPAAYFIRITALNHKPLGITINAIHSDTRA